MQPSRRRLRFLSAVWLASTDLLLLAAGLSAQAPACGTGSEYRGPELVAGGLLLRFEGETAYRLLREGSGEMGPGGERIWWAIFDFPGATKKPGPEWFNATTGPVIRIRSSLYRRDGECGVRVSLELRRSLSLTLQRRPEGYVLPIEPPGVSLRLGGGAGRAARPQPSGGVQVSGLVSASQFGGSTIRSGSEGIGFYQEITNGGWVRGFLTHLFPERDGGGTFGALGLFGFPLGQARADLVGGDISIPYASPAQDALDFPGQLLIRGGVASLRKKTDFRVFGFYGRAVTPDTARLAGTPLLAPEISRDRVAGLFGYAAAGHFTLGGGWVRSLPYQADSRDNFFESLAVAFSESLKIGAVVEESLSPKLGWQTTVFPRLRTPRFFLSGYYRYASDAFLPALGSDFFAGLKRSFQLAGAAQLSRLFVVSAAAGQTRSFNLIDPRGVGTTTEFENAAFNAQLASRLTAGLFFNGAAVRTDRGAVNPGDSRTDAFGASLGASTAPFSVNAAYSREETTDRANPSFDFRSNRATLDLFSSIPGEIRAAAQASYADSRRVSGGSAGQNFSYSLSLEKRLGRWVRAGVSGGEDVRPAGVATFGSRTTRVGARVDADTKSGFQIGASYAYEDLRTTGGPSTRGYFVSLSQSRNFSWGGGRGPFADAGRRAFNLQETIQDVSLLGAIVLRAFIDNNGNGRPDAGEEGVAGAEFMIDDTTYRTDAKGFARAWVAPGTHQVVFAVGKLAIRLSPSFPLGRDAAIRGRETVVLDSPFLAGGRVEGRVTLAGTLPQGMAAPVGGLVLRLLRGATVLRETYTSDDGQFFFENVPPGGYALEIGAGIPEDYTVEGEKRMTIEVTPDAAARPVFTLRRKTARERFGVLR